MLSTPVLRRVGAAAALAAISSACFFGDEGVKPPPPANPSLTARVGLVVATNTSSFRRLLDSPRGRGIVVVFVQPRGPADRAGLEQGDVITEVDGEPSTNAEYGVVQLRSESGASRELTVVRRNGDRSTVTVRARVPGDVDLRELYSPLISDEPDDPVLRFLRAQAQPASEFDEAIGDLDRAIDGDERFAEAYNLRAERKWTRSRLTTLSREERSDLTREALTDWREALEAESRNTRAFASVAQASALLNQPAAARASATRALELDENLPTAHYAIGLTEFNASNFEEAAGSARRAIELNPFDVRYYELLGRVFKRLERVSDCEETLRAITGLISSARERTRLLRTCL